MHDAPATRRGTTISDSKHINTIYQAPRTLESHVIMWLLIAIIKDNLFTKNYTIPSSSPSIILSAILSWKKNLDKIEWLFSMNPGDRWSNFWISSWAAGRS